MMIQFASTILLFLAFAGFAAKRGMTPQECYAYEQQGIQDYEY